VPALQHQTAAGLQHLQERLTATAAAAHLPRQTAGTRYEQPAEDHGSMGLISSGQLCDGWGALAWNELLLFAGTAVAGEHHSMLSKGP